MIKFVFLTKSKKRVYILKNWQIEVGCEELENTFTSPVQQPCLSVLNLTYYNTNKFLESSIDEPLEPWTIYACMETTNPLNLGLYMCQWDWRTQKTKYKEEELGGLLLILLIRILFIVVEGGVVRM